MENAVVKDKQIQLQAQTIESLTKTVERLERELEKCLHPGGESPKAEPVELSYRSLSERLYNTIHAAFLPTRSRYNDITNEWIYDHLPWWYFRKFLFELDEFSNHWSNRDFREGVGMLNDICQATEDFVNDVKHLDKFEMAFRLFYCGKKQKHDAKQAAVLQLISALHIIIDRWEKDYEKKDWIIRTPLCHPFRIILCHPFR